MLAPATTCARPPEEWPLIGIFTRRGVEALERIARERSLLAFDFDGTLAPLVEDREAARIARSTRALLRAAAREFPLAVVSGRAREDLVARVDGIPGVALVGNHGADPGPPLRLDTAVLFAGDDVTDEDAFESPVVDVGIRVGREPGSAARYFLEEREQIDALLEALVAARARRG